MKEEKTLHRNEIVKVIWKNIAIHPNTLDVHIYNLRKKLKTFDYGIKAIGNGLFKFIDNTPSAIAPENKKVIETENV